MNGFETAVELAQIRIQLATTLRLLRRFLVAHNKPQWMVGETDTHVAVDVHCYIDEMAEAYPGAVLPMTGEDHE